MIFKNSRKKLFPENKNENRVNFFSIRKNLNKWKFFLIQEILQKIKKIFSVFLNHSNFLKPSLTVHSAWSSWWLAGSTGSSPWKWPFPSSNHPRTVCPESRGGSSATRECCPHWEAPWFRRPGPAPASRSPSEDDG